MTEMNKADMLPMLDELIEYTKRLATSSILKSTEEASKYESFEIIKDSDLYISCIENRVRFETFQYTKEDYLRLGVSDIVVDDYIKNHDLIPKYIKKKLIDENKQKCIDNYVEKNEYYRNLNGLPRLGDPYLYIPKEIVPDNIKRMVDITKPVHLMNKSDIDLLYNLGIMDTFISMNPNESYLNHLGSKRISVYKARRAPSFYLLYATTDCPKEVSSRFKERLEINRVYTLKTIYSDAFKMDSDYYDNFIGIFIMIQTMIDMFSLLPEMIIKGEFFDIRTIEIVFKSHGIDFFPEIPFRYQLAMVKNINRLIKYKSTTKNIVDICSLFGFDNIEVFKYYLLKHRRVDKDTGDFIYNYSDEIDLETGETIKVLDDVNNYDLKFIKVPIEEECDNYIHDKTKFIDYEDITMGDKYWDGDLPHELVRKEILRKEFNYIQSKYLSVDTIYSITELSFQMTYFYNMIFDDVMVESKLTMPIPIISNTGEFKFVDIICYLYGLMYLYNGVEDDLMDTPTKVMYIKGFNFNANMADLATYIRRKGFTMKDLGIDEFQMPEESILTYEQLMYIFTKNSDIYDHVCKQLRTADNYNIYKVYQTIYDSLMINDLNMEFFRKSNGVLAKTYTDLLKDRDIILYDSITKIRNIQSLETRREKINNLVNDIIYIIEEYIDFGRFKFIFSALPSVSAEAVKQYIYKVINFFKSYKVDITGINTIYKFDDKLENKIKMIDKIFLKYIYTKEDTIEALGKMFNTAKFRYKDKSDIKEQIHFIISYWVDFLFRTDIEINEEIAEMLISTTLKDEAGVHDIPKYIISLLEKWDRIPMTDSMIQQITSTIKREHIDLLDRIYITLSTYKDKLFKQEIELMEKIGLILINLYKYDNLCPIDKKDMIVKLSKEDRFSLKDQISKRMSTRKIDNIELNENIFFYRIFTMNLYDEKYELYANTDLTVKIDKEDCTMIMDKLFIEK